MNDLIQKSTIDVVLIATIRPEILKITLSSFKNKMLYEKIFNHRIIINIDPIGDSEKTQQDIINICKEYFNDVIYNTPSTPSFPRAVKWAWAQVNSEFFLHLEDDWCLKKSVDLEEISQSFRENENLVSIRLNLRKNPNILNKTKFSLNPCVFRSSYIKNLYKKFDISKDPEKQFMDQLDTEKFPHPEFFLYGLANEGAYVIDTGKKWRKAQGLKKWGNPLDVSSWTKGKLPYIKEKYFHLKYMAFICYWKIKFCK
ncbi:hypothetical protein [Candidatus Thiothrix anitrata]|uniref:Glycosyltransferase 2-like domain-containing protein n=1 Tax=Candidatus Thiothrix anitrata TaxID=2823902 RepID=A0ABX7X0N9_9GAMM|nr:hypothetical protein [Candidatus Thiothrix anitrata]QTR48842.1 hypothetical protein J8380_11160 [Candidatus Thiothrix anitrata]